MKATPPLLERCDATQIRGALCRIGSHLRNPTRLVLIGSSVGMWYGQPGRFTEDIDVWSPRSQVDFQDVAQACEKAGVAFDPRGFGKPVGLYLQVVTPGVVHIGKYKNDVSMFSSGNLTVVHPPAEHVVASKLVRGAQVDVEDAVFLMSRCGITLDDVRFAINTLPPAPRETAQENLVFLEIHQATLDDVQAAVRHSIPGGNLGPASNQTHRRRRSAL